MAGVCKQLRTPALLYYFISLFYRRSAPDQLHARQEDALARLLHL